MTKLRFNSIEDTLVNDYQKNSFENFFVDFDEVQNSNDFDFSNSNKEYKMFDDPFSDDLVSNGEFVSFPDLDFNDLAKNEFENDINPNYENFSVEDFNNKDTDIDNKIQYFMDQIKENSKTIEDLKKQMETLEEINKELNEELETAKIRADIEKIVRER